MEFKKYRLDELATVEISGVDKKTKEGEIPVKLCNFTDVYHNWAITKDMTDDFMDASAKQSEIDVYKLKKGQVAFTKDSETRDDIGIPTYIADDFDNVILGYHNALITPDSQKLSGKYLNAFMNTKYIQKYFENNASGSGQRYTLSDDILGSIPILAPELDEQEKIGNFFSQIDRKMSINKNMNMLINKMAKELYDYWFVQFDFPNADGKPYKKSGGKLYWNDELKRNIPEGWIAKHISDLAIKQTDSINPFDNPDVEYCHFSIPGFDSVGSYVIEKGNEILSSKFLVSENEILVSKLNPWVNRVIWGQNYVNQISSTEFVVMKVNDIELKSFLYSIVKSLPFVNYCNKASTGTSHSHRRVNPDIMMNYVFAFNEELAKSYSVKTKGYFDLYMKNIEENRKLLALRNDMLNLLLNGQVSLK